MNLPKLDWRYILRHTALPTASAVGAIILLATSMWWHGKQDLLFTQVSVNQDALHEDYDSLVHRRRLVDRYHRRYEHFSQLGFVGRESRLDWVETLRESTVELTIPRVSYAIEPQLNVVAPIESILAGDSIQIHLSRLHLEVGLAHELDLLRLIDELQSKAPGLIKVDSCNMAWQAGDEERLKLGANIMADCAIQIFSIVTSDVTNQVAKL
ncbi:MAG: hypothetical protein ACR2QT_06245 [Woeseiaceae bacterium]